MGMERRGCESGKERMIIKRRNDNSWQLPGELQVREYGGFGLSY